MLRPEENKLLTEVGPGTPMGELFRRFWLPAVASKDIEEPDSAPRRLRMLGEDLIAFRDTEGRVGVVSAYCTHRRANLFFGRNEDCGLRCVYHGWKFDVDGNCVDLPSEPAGSTLPRKVGIESYPTVEKGGLVWTYMGPEDSTPDFPEYEWLEVPDSHRVINASLVECNWLQTLEGDIDTAHVSFLHRPLEKSPNNWARFVDTFSDYVSKDKAPSLTVQETEYGFVYGGRRVGGEDDFYWRFSHWLIPSTSQTPGSRERPGRVVVPIDDQHSHSFSFVWNPDRPLSQEEVIANNRDAGQEEMQPFALPDGYIIDTRRSRLNRQNDFKIDRHVQKTKRFSGIYGTPPEEDRAMTESMEPVLDRSREHLGTSDIAIIAARRRLLRLAKELQEGKEPELARKGWAFRTRGFDVVSSVPEFQAAVEEHRDEIMPPEPNPHAAT